MAQRDNSNVRVNAIMNLLAWILWYISLCVSASSSIEKNIIGGDLTTIKIVPYLAHMEYLGFVCSASIISDLWVVTAGWCINFHPKPNEWVVVVGTGRLDYVGERQRVVLWVRHPLYLWNLQDYDFAVVSVEKSMLIADIAVPIAMPKQDEPTPSSVEARITGWGMVNKDVQEMSNRVHTAWMQTYSDEECQLYLHTQYTQRKLCAKQTRGNISVATNDLGGPLVINNVLYGIILPRLDAHYQDINGVKQFARISTVRDWIAKITGV